MNNYYYNSEPFVRLFNTPYKNACDEQSPLASQPEAIKVGLRSHQLAVVHKMGQLENYLQNGYDVSGQTLFSRFAVLGDSVGVGKSLMVLSHIAKMKDETRLKSTYMLNKHSSQNLFSYSRSSYSDLSHCPALIVIPHILFTQWRDYIEKQTTLRGFSIRTKKSFEDPNFFKKITESDLVLVSNTLLGNFLAICDNRLYFSRTFFDEADSIYISSTQYFPVTNFVWLITASWPNIMFENDRIWLSSAIVRSIAERSEFNEYDPLFRAQITNSLASNGFYNRYTSKSPLYFRDFMRLQHQYRTHLIILCKKEFIESSVQLPPIFTQVIHCEPSMAHRIVNSAIPPHIQSLLNAGDTQAALSALGVPTETPKDLIQAVTENRIRELERLQKTYAFKSSIEYASQTQKEQSLANLSQKIKSLEQQIDSIKTRIQNYSKEICVICYDEPQAPCLTPCCSRIFCATCILMSLTRAANCPMCRAQIVPNSLHSVGEAPKRKKKDEAPKGPPRKIDALLTLIKENPKEKFLVFSRYENPFRQMQERLEFENIKVESVKGNKDVINSLLTKFEKGDINVLLLNSQHAGQGLNITSATYVVLWHKMNPEEEKQIIGRAYRMGRTAPLHFVKLLHPDEGN
jgi:hypothetical protein